jgi:hypothetical protein
VRTYENCGAMSVNVARWGDEAWAVALRESAKNPEPCWRLYRLIDSIDAEAASSLARADALGAAER